MGQARLAAVAGEARRRVRAVLRAWQDPVDEDITSLLTSQASTLVHASLMSGPDRRRRPNMMVISITVESTPCRVPPRSTCALAGYRT